MADIRDEVTKALRRRRGFDGDTSAALNKAAEHTGISNFTVADLADCIAIGMKLTEAKLVAHAMRLYKLSNAKINIVDQKKGGVDHNLHARVTALESEVRRLLRSRR